MAKQRSQASRFKSPSTGEYCTAAQYIAEVLVQRKAEKDNKGSLAYKFWNKTRKKQYSLQIQKVHQLISEFGERAVYDYIINKNKRVYSAAPKWVKDEIKKHKKLLSSKPKPKQSDIIEVEKDNVNVKPRKSFGNKSLFSRLRSSDGKSKNK
jgi:hypothetical protein